MHPDIVFTLFGPAYVRFETLHVCGIANAWTTHPNAYAYRTLSLRQRVQARLGRIYRLHSLRHADAWVAEAEAARVALVRDLGFPADRVTTIPNSCADQYRSAPSDRGTLPNRTELNLLVLSAYYPHKHLEIVPHVAAALHRQRPELSFVFSLTLDVRAKPFQQIAMTATKLQVSEHVRSIGMLDIEQCPRAYADSDIVFLPTLLETNTAVYHEAMAMGIAIVTTNLDFATSICRDSAVYFEPMNAESAAAAILRLVDSPSFRVACIDAGRAISDSMPTQSRRYEAYIRFLESQFHRCRCNPHPSPAPGSGDRMP